LHTGATLKLLISGEDRLTDELNHLSIYPPRLSIILE